MLNRAILLGLCLVLGLSSTESRGQTVRGRELSWDQLKSPFLIFNEVAPVDRTWLRMQAGESVALSYDVGLKTSDLVPSECQWENYQQKNPGFAIAQLTANYLEKCEERLRLPSWGWAENYYRTMFIRIKVSEHPFFKKVLLRLPNGYQQPGLLALKDTETRRPLIIFRAGIFGNSIDIQAERHLIMQLFEQSPVNLLFLDSLTSPETVKWNQRYSAGGLDEGLQNYQVAAQILNPEEPLSKLVSKIHLLGISMGGHGVFMSLLLNRWNPRVFESAMAFCPLVQFQKTFELHRSTTVGYFFMNFWAYFRLSSLRDRVEGLSLTRFLTDVFRTVSQSYAGPITDEGRVHFPSSSGFSTKDFYQGNDLLPLLNQIQDSVTVFATRNDNLVPLELNFQALQQAVSGQKNFHLFELPKGYHCSLPGAYDWDQFSALVREQVLARTAELQSQMERVAISVPAVTEEIPESAPLTFSTGIGSNHILAQLPHRAGPLLSVRIPLEQTDWAAGKWVRTETEARALIRWSRAQIRLIRAPHPEIYWFRVKSANSGPTEKSPSPGKASSNKAPDRPAGVPGNG